MKLLIHLAFLSVFLLDFGVVESLESYEIEETENVNAHYLSVGAIFQNESRYLREWIEYHKILGVTHFYLYNNLSTDNYYEVLESYIKRGEVDLIDWEFTDYPVCQLTAYNDVIQKSRGKTKWLAIIDIDEFVVPVQSDNLVEFLNNYEEYAGVVVNWQLFGTSYIFSLPKDALLTEHLVYKFPADFNYPEWSSNYFVKSIIQPNLVEDCCWSSHFFNAKPGYFIVDSNQEPILIPSTQNPKLPIDLIRINHYWFRTLDWFYQVKIQRREADGYKYSDELIDYILEMGHSEEDYTIFRFLNKLKENLSNDQERMDEGIIDSVDHFLHHESNSRRRKTVCNW